MKRINILLAALAAMVAFASCEKPGPDGPDTPEVTVTFPALVENYEVKPGETLSLTFTPAMDWTVSVPSENLQWFWIADGTFKVDKLSRKASAEAVTVKIGVSETEEFDTNRSCDVTLAIGDQSKVIAKYMRPAKERTLAVYMAELDETGGYKLAEDGESYIYGTTEAASVALAWSASDADFRAPLRVESNGEWTITYPEWLTVNVPEKTAGVAEIILTGASLEDVSGKIAFKAGDKVKFNVYNKNGYGKEPLMTKEVIVEKAADSVSIPLMEEDTTFGPLINKATIYWYDISLNDYMTIVGYNEDGAKEFIQYPAKGDEE